jgi:hypothetical protein
MGNEIEKMKYQIACIGNALSGIYHELKDLENLVLESTDEESLNENVTLSSLVVSLDLSEDDVRMIFDVFDIYLENLEKGEVFDYFMIETSIRNKISYIGYQNVKLIFIYLYKMNRFVPVIDYVMEKYEYAPSELQDLKRKALSKKNKG